MGHVLMGRVGRCVRYSCRLAAESLGLGDMRFSQKPGLRATGLAGSLGLAILLVHADRWLAADQWFVPSGAVLPLTKLD